MAKRIALALALLLLTAQALGCGYKPEQKEPESDQRMTLGTLVSITLYDSRDSALLDGCFTLCQQYEALLDANNSASDIARVNSANGAPTQVDARTAEVIRQGLTYSELSQGAYDLTDAPVAALWSFGAGQAVVPDEAQLSQVVALVNWRNVVLAENTVTLNNGAQLDVNGIAMGCIADALSKYLRDNKCNSARIELGSLVLALGKQPGGGAQSVEVSEPFAESEALLGTAHISDLCMATRGVYQQYFEQDGQVYHSILDPRTGKSANNDLSSVSVFAASGAACAALSYACFVLGSQDGLALIKGMDGVEAVFCTQTGELIRSPGIGTTIPFDEEPIMG